MSLISSSFFPLIFKAIMRSFSLLQEAIVPYIPTLIGQLTHKLLLVSKVTHTLSLFMDAERVIIWWFIWAIHVSYIQNLSPIFRIPANLISTTTCLSPCACRFGSPARPTPPLSAASRKHSSPSSLRSFRTMFRVCHLILVLSRLQVDGTQINTACS